MAQMTLHPVCPDNAKIQTDWVQTSYPYRIRHYSHRFPHPAHGGGLTWTLPHISRHQSSSRLLARVSSHSNTCLRVRCKVGSVKKQLSNWRHWPQGDLSNFAAAESKPWNHHCKPNQSAELTLIDRICVVGSYALPGFDSVQEDANKLGIIGIVDGCFPCELPVFKLPWLCEREWEKRFKLCDRFGRMPTPRLGRIISKITAQRIIFEVESLPSEIVLFRALNILPFPVIRSIFHSPVSSAAFNSIGETDFGPRRQKSLSERQ